MPAEVGSRVPDDTNSNQLGVLGRSAAVVALRATVRRMADAPYTVLFTGESGSGKELVAKAVRRLSRRAVRRFGAVNCAALADELVEAELFGYIKGAFTGAVTDRAGLFEASDRDTLLLDEVGELSQRAQAKQLRFLQDGEIRRVGESQSRRVVFRVVAATNRPLDAAVGTGQFREDLLYRMDVLRMLVRRCGTEATMCGSSQNIFWSRTQVLTGSRAAPAKSTLAALSRYHWPGNVRQLENVIASLVVRGPRHGVMGPSTLPPLPSA